MKISVVYTIVMTFWGKGLIQTGYAFFHLEKKAIMVKGKVENEE